MKIGQKVTVKFLSQRPFPFLRCYIIRRLADGWQLYDPVRNWSWGMDEKQSGDRVITA